MTVTLGAPNRGTFSTLIWEFADGAVPIEPSLLEDSNTVGYLRYFSIATLGRASLRTAVAGGTGQTSDRGPELIADWETADGACTLAAAALTNDISFAGPDHPDAGTYADSSEPYAWIVPGGVSNSNATGYATVSALTDAQLADLTLTLTAPAATTTSTAAPED